MPLNRLLREVRACTVCAADLPLGARPVLQVATSARLLIVGQAPGRKVHETGVPWDDASGERLREWMAIDPSTFHDAARVAILPMGLCYPGRAPAGGDRPPRPECAPLWQERLLRQLPAVEHTLLVGHHAQRFHLGTTRKASMTDTVRSFRDYAPRFMPLPHPSWRSVVWMRKHPWFEATVLPELRRIVRAAVRR
jgi:uracil-DNA glycosylase